MALTSAQLATLKADIAANTNTIPAGQPWTNSFAGQAINTIPNAGDGNATIAAWYNQTASPAYVVWRTEAPIMAIRAGVTLANYTPVDAVPTGPSTDLTYLNRAIQQLGPPR